MPLHFELRRMLDQTPPEAHLNMTQMDVDEAVRDLRARPYPAIDIEGAVQTEDIRIAGSGDEVPVRLYQPSQPHGVLVHFHGGGWVTGSIGQDDYFCQTLARDAGCVVVSVDYRLAPEHPFPKPLDDCIAATQWAADHATDLAGRGAKLAVSGISAGGNLAAAVALNARDADGPQLHCQVLMYPVCDGAMDYPSCAENAQGYYLTSDAMEWFWQQYAPAPTQRFNPLASVLRAGSLRGLPRAVVMTCEFDPLRDEGNAFARRLAESGVPVLHRELPGMIHGFLRRGWNRPWVQQPMAEVTAELTRALA